MRILNRFILFGFTAVALLLQAETEQPGVGFLQKTGADVIRLSPITDRILMVEFCEGIILYGGIGSTKQENTPLYNLLDTDKASAPERYRLTSTDDRDFGPGGISPIHVGRKSKGHQFNDLFAFQRGDPTHLLRHQIYLEWPEPMKQGKSYQVHLNGLAANSNVWSFVFDARSMHSETIHVNQVAYRTSTPKFGYISQFMGDFDSKTHSEGGLNLDDYAKEPFYIIRLSDGGIAYEGTLELQKPKTERDTWTPPRDVGPTQNLSRADVWQADFSGLKEPGHYRLVVRRMGASFPFEISDDAFRRPYVAAMRGLFFQRAGIDRLVREHGDLIYPGAFRNNQMYFNPEGGREHTNEVLDTSRPVEGVWGWYHDAGDWDGYPHLHAKVPALLLLTYEINPGAFGDGDVGNVWRRSPEDPWIDEGKNGIPDILDEAGWLLNFMRRARHALVKHGYGTGGVPAYVGREGCGPDGVASWTDTRPQLLHGEDVGATALHAGLSAWYAASLRRAGVDEAIVQDWLDEAIDAFHWAKSSGAEGEYLMLGALGLYRATGETRYQDDVVASFKLDEYPWHWFDFWNDPSHRLIAACLFALLPEDHPGLNRQLQERLRSLMTGSGNQDMPGLWLREGLSRGFRPTHLTRQQRIHTGSLSTPRTLILRVANAVSKGAGTYPNSQMGDVRFDHAAQFAADYTLGGNQMSFVYLSGLGWRHESAVFHRDSRYLLNFNHPVYGLMAFPGYTVYGSRSSFDIFGQQYRSAADEDFSRSTAYPVIWRKTGASFDGMGPVYKNSGSIPNWAPKDSLGDGPGNDTLFPVGEWRFPNPFAISSAEFTVHQTLAHAAFTYASLLDRFQPFREQPRPRVKLLLDQNQSIAIGEAVSLKVSPSDSTWEVEYYYGHHFIGRSHDVRTGFALRWDTSKFILTPGEHRITARAYTVGGHSSLPEPEGERFVVFRDAGANP